MLTFVMNSIFVKLQMDGWLQTARWIDDTLQNTFYNSNESWSYISQSICNLEVLYKTTDLCNQIEVHSTHH